ncbi:hypothetical protein [Bdellovibrio sp. HCB337]|uniref:hypothetical protein n=1 Tax=Bdellovibrio sp. HCB337 TaxID=3394358 RepID=UPI0039A41469
MGLKKAVYGVFAVLLSACVTETKPADSKPFVATVPTEVAVKTNPPPERGDVVPGNIVVKCRTKFDKDPKRTFLCGPTTVKIVNEVSKADQEHSFKGDKVAIPVARDASYAIEVKTKGCAEPRSYLGMTSGMVVTIQFENCGGATVSK